MNMPDYARSSGACSAALMTLAPLLEEQARLYPGNPTLIAAANVAKAGLRRHEELMAGVVGADRMLVEG